jgi:hypothetical protein
MGRVVGAGSFGVMVACLLAASTGAQTEVLDRAFPPGGTVVLDLSAGEYDIVGTTENRIHVDWRESDSRDVNVGVDVKGREATIWIDGPLTDGAEALVELPQRTNLVVTLSAGELRIRRLEGSKNVSARAGEIDIEVGERNQYRQVDASVRIGELRADAFDVKKEGFFRSFAWVGKGQYDLRAHLTVGELNLNRAPAR